MTNMTNKELEAELKRLEITVPAKATKADLAKLVADAHGDPEGIPHKLTKEDMEANAFEGIEDLKEGDIVILPQEGDDGEDEDEAAGKKDEPKGDGTYEVLSRIKHNGEVYEPGSRIALTKEEAERLLTAEIVK